MHQGDGNDSKTTTPGLARLQVARADEPGANLYNAYIYLTQIAALYAQAGQANQSPGVSSLWQELCDRTLDDLGELFTAWETTVMDARVGKSVIADPTIHPLLERSCQRTAVILERVNLWTPTYRWIRLLSRAERRWLRLLARLGELNPIIRPRLETAHRGSLDRFSRLVGMAEKVNAEAALIDGYFKTDDDSSLATLVGT